MQIITVSSFRADLYLPGFVPRPGKGRGGGGRASGRDRGRGRGDRDRDRYDRRDEKSSGKALPKSLARTRTCSKSGDSIRPEVSTMPLQRIFMTNENQEQLKELLRELQTQEIDEPYE